MCSDFWSRSLFLRICQWFWRLYIFYECPFAQRTWITRNYKVWDICSIELEIGMMKLKKDMYIWHPNSNWGVWKYYMFHVTYFLEQGLEDTIKLVPLSIQDRPAWFKEKVYPENKVTIPLACMLQLTMISWIWFICGKKHREDLWYELWRK